MSEITMLSEDIHETAVSKGWWEGEKNVPELLCLVHSEVSEALEAYRKDDLANFAEELADIVIRVFDMSVGLKVDIEHEILTKMEANEKRSYRHGGKKC